MRNIPKTVILAVAMVVLLVSTSACLAGPRQYNSGYRSHKTYPTTYNHYRYKTHHLKPSRYLGYLGAGIVAGALLGTILSPLERGVVYARPAPVAVYSRPVYPQTVVVHQQPVEFNTIPRQCPAELVLRRVTATADLLNIRSGPELTAPITGQVNAGTVLDVIGAAPEWLYVKTGPGQYGWVMSQYTLDSGGPVG